MMRIALVVARVFGSFKTELQILAITFAVILLLPAVAAVALVNAPLQAVSDALAWLNPTTHKVEYKDPKGLVRQLDLETVWPTKGSISQEFGVPNPPYEISHTGIDVAAPKGTPVVAAMAGKVTKAGKDFTGGLSVDIDHGHGITSHSAHLSKVLATVGQEVKVGDVIGEVGDTGWAFGNHLHFSIRVSGLLVNPRVFMVGSPPPL